jgi:uncharacterized protein (TIGR03086 family)
MTAAGESVEMLATALDQAGTLIERIKPEQATLRTPCRSWNLRDLVNHVVEDVDHFTAIAKGERWQKPGGDLIGDDWAGAYRKAAAGLLEVWRRPGQLDRTVQLPFGERPASWQVGQAMSDLAVHTWDIARATGQPTDLDPEVGRMSLEWGRENLTPQFRGEEADGMVFGTEVPVSDDAPVYDRLAGYFGRDPS